MMDASVKSAPTSPEKVVEFNEAVERDDFGYFLENDPELQIAYDACLRTVGLEWTDEEIAEATFRMQYGDNIDALMQQWHFRQDIKAGDRKAVAVHIAVVKSVRRQKQAHARV